MNAPTSVGSDAGPCRGPAVLARAVPQDNTLAVLRHLHSHGPASRAQLARATGLSKVTASEIVGRLIERQLARELPRSPGASFGRPATPVVFDPTAHHIVAVDLSDTRNQRGALIDLSGTVILRKTDYVGTTRGQAAVDRVCTLIASLSEASDKNVVGAGVATPGSIDSDGTFLVETYFGWEGRNLTGELEPRLGMPVMVGNDANCAAWGEVAFGRAANRSTLAMVIGHGVGSGLVLDGAVVRGASSAAGEIGHLLADQSGTLCGCGRRGCLETFISLPTLERLADYPSELADVGWKTGSVLAPIVAALNLGEIVLVAPPDLVDGPFLTSLEAAIAAHTHPKLNEHLIVRVSSLGHDATLVGASAMVTSALFGLH